MIHSSEITSSRLRVLIATITEEAAAMTAHATDGETRSTAGRLQHAVAETVELLELGSEPEVRSCPVCSSLIRRAATRCGHCWSLVKPAPSAAEARNAVT